ncbi:MAG: M36 family metallopeptidase [Byssovorax sp.]
MKRSVQYLMFSVPLLLGSLAQAKDLPNFNAYAAAKPIAARLAPFSAPAGAPPAFVSSTDERRGVPTFLWAARDAVASTSALAPLGPEAAARLHLARHAERYGLGPSALGTAEVTHVHDLGTGGIIVVLRQRVGGVALIRQDVKVLMDRSLQLIAITGNLHAGAVPTPKGAAFKVPETQAIASALADLYGPSFLPADLVSTKKEKAEFRYYDLVGTAAKAHSLRFSTPSRVKKVFFPLPDKIVPAYYLELRSGDPASTTSDAYGYVFAADDGRLLYRENQTHFDAFNYRVWADKTGDLRPADGPMADFTPHPTGTPDGSYPPFVAPSLVTMDGFNKNPSNTFDPWLPAGATETKGNNVDAYTDDGAPDGFSAGDVRASITAAGTFDRVYDVSLGPQTNDNQRMASVTQIFYVTNWLHDWWYDSGFTEAAGNGQANNLGRGGVAGDPVLAEAQDSAPTQRNNANMSAGVDGESPRMQMYVWDGAAGAMSLSIPGVGANLTTNTADFGPQNYNVTGTVVLAVDATAPVNDGCEAIINDVSGKIALIDRGLCPFEQKAQNAQAAGAIAVLLVNNKPGGAPQMPGSPNNGVTIPIMSMTQADGATLKAALLNGAVTATLQRAATADRDGTIDNTVVAHEWAHYLHGRLVPGCGSAQCGGEGEGWGDTDAFMMEVRAGDNLDGTFAAAQYATASFLDAGYFGIRRYPYSTNMSKDPLTFKHISSGEPLPAGIPVADSGGDNSEVHNAGEIWATMMFEAYVALLKQTQGPNPVYSFDEAHRRMSNYIVGGMKLAPTDPTYTEQRDGVLATAIAADPNDFNLMAQAFAKRGAGTCAVSPARDSQDLTGVVESFTVNPNIQILSVKIDDSISSCDSDGNLDADETGNIAVKVMNGGPATMSSTTVDVAIGAKGVTFPNGSKVDLGPLAAYATATAEIQIKLDSSFTKKANLDLQVNVTNPEACNPKQTLATAPLVNFDEVKTSATLDDVEAAGTVWKVTGDGSDAIWGRREGAAGNHVWRGIDFASPSDTALVSPPLDVSPTDDFILTFSHAHQFETSMNTNWDGSVIELSLNGGNTWQDISKWGDPGYGGPIGDPMNQANNVLNGRQGYIDHNPSFPARDTVTVNMGKKLAGKTVQVRFRIGTDDAAGEFGWELDDLGFQGITNKPFSALIDDATVCAGTPKADAGPDQTVTSGEMVVLDASKSSDPKNLPLTFAWQETAGATVVLSGDMAVMAQFTAPPVTMPTTLVFQVVASDGKASASDTVNILVNPTMSTSSAGGGGGDTGGSTTGGTPPSAFGGCGCFIGGAPADTSFTVPLLALSALLIRRRRRVSGQA